MEAPVKTDRTGVAIALTLVVIGVLLRAMPHPANFAPMAAIAIFGGALLPRYWGVVVPLTAMIVSDMFIGMHSLFIVTWGCYALIALTSHVALKKPALNNGIIITISSSVFFFLVTNFAVWAEGRLYPRTLSGLTDAYVLALPFFRNTLLGDLFYTGLLFGLYCLSQRTVGVYESKTGLSNN